MRRLQALDFLLLAFFSPIWGLCFGLYLHRVTSDCLAWTPVFVATPNSAEDYPMVNGFWVDSGAEHALAFGDRLQRVGDSDLRGVSSFEFVVRVYDAIDAQQQFSVSYLRGQSVEEATLTLRHIGFPWRMLPLSLGFAVVAFLALLRAPSPRLSRTFFLASMTYSLYWTFCFGGGPRLLTYAWATVFAYASFFMFPLWVRTLLLFAEEIAPTGIRLPLWPWLFLVYGVAMTSMAFGTPFPHAVGLQSNFVLNTVFAATMLVVLVRNFLRTGPIGRRQLKWAVYGIYLSALPVILVDIVTMLHPSWLRLHEMVTVSLVSVPVCLLIAIVRFNLFDIDHLISTTAASSVFLVAFLGGVLIAAPQFSQASSITLGGEYPSWQIAVAVLFVSIALPVQRYLRAQIERFFFAERYALEQGLNSLLQELPASTHKQAMLKLIGERVATLVNADPCVIYEAVGEHYTPVFTRATISPPSFAVRRPLIDALRTQSTYRDRERWRRVVRTQLPSEDYAILDRLQVEIFLPIGHAEFPVAFLCLGAKQSGDIYTTTDLLRLRSVTEQASEKLLQLTQASA